MNKTQSAAGAETELARKKLVAVGRFFRLLLIILIVLGSILIVRTFDLDVPSFWSKECADSNIYTTLKNTKLTDQSTQPYRVEFAKTNPQQELGLSDRPCFPKDGALLFLFPTDDRFGIWMKNMKFNIDVIWLNKDKQVVHIVSNMEPKSFPSTVYTPPSDARFVIEVNAGQAQDVLRAKVGTQFNW